MSPQRGVAAITAILIVAVAASAATMMLARQSAMIDQALMVTSRAQADLYAQAGVDWARGVLREDAARTPGIDTLQEAWAQPIAALPVDRALIAGSLVDEQGKLNLNNLVNGNQRSDPDVQALRTLLARLGLPEELAEAVLDWIDSNDDLAGNGGAENAYYFGLASPYAAANTAMLQVEELYRVKGFDAKTVAKLRPHVTALPGRVAVNVNTASDAVLAAMLGIDLDKARTLVAERRAKPFVSRNDFMTRIARLGLTMVAVEHDVKSAFFLAHVRVSQDDVHLATEALLKRADDGRTTVAWRRPRY